MPDEQARGLDLGGHVGDLLLDQLVVADRLVAYDSLARVPRPRRPGSSARRRLPGTATVSRPLFDSGHRDGEAPADLAQPRLRTEPTWSSTSSPVDNGRKPILFLNGWTETPGVSFGTMNAVIPARRIDGSSVAKVTKKDAMSRLEIQVFGAVQDVAAVAVLDISGAQPGDIRVPSCGSVTPAPP